MLEGTPTKHRKLLREKVQAVMITVELDSGKIVHACADVSATKESSKLNFNIMLL